MCSSKLGLVQQGPSVECQHNWNFQSDKATAINALEASMHPYLVWFKKSKEIKLDGYEQPIIQWQHTHLPNTFKLLLSHSDLAHSV